MQRIQKEFLLNSSTAKIKHESNCNAFQNCGLRNLDISATLTSLQFTSIKRLYDQRFYDSKVIPLKLIDSTFDNNFKFYLNLVFDDSQYSFFYRTILRSQKNHFFHTSYTPSCTKYQFLWFNKDFRISNKPSLFLKSFLKNINVLNQFLTSYSDLNNLSVIKRKFELNNKLYYSWTQMARHAIPGELKSILRNTHLSNINIYLYHHVIKKIYVLSL